MGRLLWDRWNEPHLTRRRPGVRPVTRADVEAVNAAPGSYVFAHWHQQADGSVVEQHKLVGSDSQGRLITVVCEAVERSGEAWYRPITAFPSSREEARRFHERD